jgi:hypothetical protein
MSRRSSSERSLCFLFLPRKFNSQAASSYLKSGAPRVMSCEKNWLDRHKKAQGISRSWLMYDEEEFRKVIT